MSEPKRIQVAQIVGSFGLKGQLKILLLTDFMERLEAGRRLLLNGDWVEIVECSWHKNRPLLRLSGINSLDKAEAYKWEYLEALQEERMPLEEDEFYTDELVGLRVLAVDGEELGVVDEVLAYPAHDTLRVGEILIPAVKQFVKKVDLEAKTLTVELIPGMRPGEDA